ncbi:hypothetical protein [Pseudomonas extremaustralis]|uniref:hypothetical protein n=1 Tax=Pseudomonas extremaustralis TaxID=359110 RepID=UPI00230734BE|nr:hypothetical protein [Pseudomonas extremaustralis]MDB1108098.1 hypothetical protein [Pseudomonas extremaustralis]
MTDKMREEFEASVLSEYPSQNMGRFATGDYQSTTIEHCWWAWKKSREVLVIELPDEDGMQGHLWAPDVVAAMEAAGVKVKS